MLEGIRGVAAACGILVSGLVALALPAAAEAPVRVGFLTTLSGPGSDFGTAQLNGARMYADDLNAAGGVLGRKVEILAYDSKSDADEAAKGAHELVTTRGAIFLMGGFTSREAPRLSEAARDLKTVYISVSARTEQLTASENLHPYVFRTTTNTTLESRSAAAIAARFRVRRVATIGQAFAYGQDAVRVFTERLTTLRPDMEIVDQQWPSLGETDFTPFIKAQLAARPEVVFSAICCGMFPTFARQAKALGYFEAIGSRFINAADAGSIEIMRQFGGDAPYGIIVNTADDALWRGEEWSGDDAHAAFIRRLKEYFREEYPPSNAILGYLGMQFLTEAIRKAGTTDSVRVSKALENLEVDTPYGRPLTLRAKDHQLNLGSLWGRYAKSATHAHPILEDLEYIDPTDFID